MKQFSILKYLAFFFIFFLILVSCSSGTTDFVITNDSQISRTDEPIILTRKMISDKTGSIPIGKIPLPYSADGNPIPSQLDDLDMDDTWDELVFVMDIAADTSDIITIRFVDENELPKFNQRTNVRFGVKGDSGIEPKKKLSIAADEVPTEPFARFQMDGPAWENDKIGFRHYIDGRNARDLYGKKLPTMALDTVGIADDGNPEDNYHVMLPWGRDILAVGNSLGLGGLGILEHGKPKRVGITLNDEKNNVDTTTYQLISEGPVRSIFTLTYKGWNTGENEYTLKNKVTIWAGSYGYINDVELTSPNSSDTLLAGLVNINNDQPYVLNEENSDYTILYSHDKQTYNDEFYLGMALVLPNAPFLEVRNAPDSGAGIINSYLSLLELNDKKSLEYYVFAGWEISDERFTDADYFGDFISSSADKISHPVRIE